LKDKFGDMTIMASLLIDLKNACLALGAEDLLWKMEGNNFDFKRGSRRFSKLADEENE
jgi:hypothetical protein